MCAYNLDTFNPTTAWSKRRSNHNDRDGGEIGRGSGGIRFRVELPQAAGDPVKTVIIRTSTRHVRWLNRRQKRVGERESGLGWVTRLVGLNVMCIH